MIQRSLNVGFVLTRISGNDGVSLETKKWDRVLREAGHSTYFIAGELDTADEKSKKVERFHFKHPEAMEIYQRSFSEEGDRTPELSNRIRTSAEDLKQELYDFVDQFDIDILIAENTLTIPVHISLGLGLTEFIAETSFPTIAHHHDFFWERNRFLTNCVWDYLNAAFPPTFHSIEHVVINSSGAHQLSHRKGLTSTLIPNVWDFSEPPGPLDDYASDVREDFGISEDETLVLQPTRIVPRKRIELAIELVSYLERPCKLMITHASGDEGYEYEQHLRRYADHMNVDTRFVAERIGPERGETEDGRKIYSLEDVYPHADLVTYPSEIEGFGNAFIEAVYFKQPVVVNNYSVFEQDIKPKGFEVIDFDGYITSETVEQTQEILDNETRRESMVETNYKLGKRYYSHEFLRSRLLPLFEEFFGV